MFANRVWTAGGGWYHKLDRRGRCGRWSLGATRVDLPDACATKCCDCDYDGWSNRRNRNCGRPVSVALSNCHLAAAKLSSSCCPIVKLTQPNYRRPSLMVLDRRRIGGKMGGSLEESWAGKIKANVNVCKLRPCLHVGLLALLFGSTRCRSGNPSLAQGLSTSCIFVVA